MADPHLKPTCADEHPDFREHCDDCRKDYDALMGVLEGQAKESDQIVQRLAQVGVQMPAHLVLAAQVEALVEAINTTKRSRMAYEYVVGTKVLDALRDGQKQMSKHTDSLVTPERGLHVVRKGH